MRIKQIYQAMQKNVQLTCITRPASSSVGPAVSTKDDDGSSLGSAASIKVDDTVTPVSSTFSGGSSVKSLVLVLVSARDTPTSISLAVTLKLVTSLAPKNSPGERGRIILPFDKFIPYSPRPYWQQIPSSSAGNRDTGKDKEGEGTHFMLDYRRCTVLQIRYIIQFCITENSPS